MWEGSRRWSRYIFHCALDPLHHSFPEECTENRQPTPPHRGQRPSPACYRYPSWIIIILPSSIYSYLYFACAALHDAPRFAPPPHHSPPIRYQISTISTISTMSTISAVYHHHQHRRDACIHGPNQPTGKQQINNHAGWRGGVIFRSSVAGQFSYYCWRVRI